MSHLFFSNQTTAEENAPSINWYTEDYPPFNYPLAGKIHGIAIDLLRQAYANLNWPLEEQKIKVMPWPRVYYTLEKEANACVFSMTYTKERAKRFNFVGNVMPNTVAIIGHAESKINEKQLKQDKHLRFGVVKNDIGHQTLMQYGIPEQQYVYLKSGYELVQMLQHKRVDLIAYGEIIAQYQFEKASIDPNNFRVIKPLLKSYLGFACNKRIPSDVLNTLDQSINKVAIERKDLIQY